MASAFTLTRTTTADENFQKLVTQLDRELWEELKEDQATYDQYNKVPAIKTAVIIYAHKEPVACGCFKPHNDETVEIKRMFVQKNFRGKGLSKMVLLALEQWAIEGGYRAAILETSIHFQTAKSLYTKSGYQIIVNYGPYAGLAESVCMRKELTIKATTSQ
jgi:putative acetyltransferase